MYPSIRSTERFSFGTFVSRAIFFILLFQISIASSISSDFGRFPNSDSLNLLKRNEQVSTSSYEAVSKQITEKQFLQTRFNFGVNFGGCFVREKWIFPSLFPKDTETELEAVTKAYEENKENTKQVLEKHWTSYVSEEEWDWLKENKVNSIRVPIGYWNIDGGKFTEGTLFEPVKEVYENSWKIFKEYFIEPASKRGISILVDLHSVPGGANPNSHNGEHLEKTEFWKNQKYQEIVIKALQFVAKDLKDYNNIYGIQVVNEADFSSTAIAEKAFYKDALTAIRQEDSVIPVVISDGWWPNQWATWIQDGQIDGSGLVVDHHCYRGFADADTSKSAQQIITDLTGDLLNDLTNEGRGVDFMVAEWSCVLAPETWKKSGVDPNNDNDPKRLELVSEFCSKEENLIEQRARAGSFFWTFKFESGNGGEWDFKRQLGRSFHPPKVSVPENSTLENTREKNLKQNLDKSPHFNKEMYKEGYESGWNDGLFYAKRGSLMGRKEAVKEARKQQFLRPNDKISGSGDWDHGYDQGLQELETVVSGP